MSQTSRDYSEKRDFIRMRVDADVVLIHEGDQISARCASTSPAAACRLKRRGSSRSATACACA